MRKFSSKGNELDKTRHINPTTLKFRNLIRKEVLPIALAACSLALAWTYRTELENMLPASETLTARDERQITKKLSDLIGYQHQFGGLTMSADLIDMQLVQ